MLNILAITQARTSSTRLPGKVLKKIGTHTLLELHINRILQSKKISKLIVATTTEVSDKAIVDLCNNIKIESYRGSLADVLDRFYQAALPYKPDYVIRLTSDCPLIDAKVIDLVVDTMLKTKVDYCSNTISPTYPNGLDVEVFTFAALEKAWKEAHLQSDREHVTPYIYRNSNLMGGALFTALNVSNSVNYEAIRLTVDEQNDFEVISGLVNALGTAAPWEAYTEYYLKHPELNKLNQGINRNEGYLKSLKNDHTAKKDL